MRILRDTITYLAGSGYRTLQIPNVAINLPAPTPEIRDHGFSDEDLERMRNFEPEYEEVPDEWIVHVHSGCRRYCLTDRERRHSFLHLSRAGFEANREAIRQAFENSPMKRGTWEQFLADAEEEWRKLEAGTERYRANLRRKLTQIAG